MTLETLVWWMAMGLISGWLASALVGGGYGLIGDIVIGVVGAFLGGLVFRSLGAHVPVSGFAGTTIVAFVGAVIVLVALRLLRHVGWWRHS